MADSKADVMPAAGGKASAPWLFHAGLDRAVMDEFARSMTGENDERSRHNLEKSLRDQATELAGPEPSAAVRMLAESAALCWAELRRAEMRYTVGGSGNRTIGQADHQQRCIDRCHSRLMRTLRTLAQVRRLEGNAPAVQVNVVQAVNVGGPVPPSPGPN